MTSPGAADSGMAGAPEVRAATRCAAASPEAATPRPATETSRTSSRSCASCSPPLFIWMLLADGGRTWAAALSGGRACSSSRSPPTASTASWRAGRTSSPTSASFSTRSPTRCSPAGALVALSILGELWWWVTIVILVRELGITAFRFAVLRNRVVAASPGGKLKTVVQSVAISLYLVPLWVVPGRLDALGQRRRHGRRRRADGADRDRLPGQGGPSEPARPCLTTCRRRSSRRLTAGGETIAVAESLTGGAAGGRADQDARRVGRGQRRHRRLPHGAEAHAARRGCRAARRARRRASGGRRADGGRGAPGAGGGRRARRPSDCRRPGLPDPIRRTAIRSERCSSVWPAAATCTPARSALGGTRNEIRGAVVDAALRWLARVGLRFAELPGHGPGIIPVSIPLQIAVNKRNTDCTG